MRRNYRNSTSAVLDGIAVLTMLPRGEDYTMTIPYAHCKGILMGTLSMELGGKVNIISVSWRCGINEPSCGTNTLRKGNFSYYFRILGWIDFLITDKRTGILLLQAESRSSLSVLKSSKRQLSNNMPLTETHDSGSSSAEAHTDSSQSLGKRRRSTARLIGIMKEVEHQVIEHAWCRYFMIMVKWIILQKKYNDIIFIPNTIYI
ncbi:uncharacterized protein [Temnothorax nylanderi]|uniref:uncharacterized protein n=1 Tax=Temnothorax nylanderi TaxID=102681 RepID=UPI003A8ABCF6